jgi:hypothetical protein
MAYSSTSRTACVEVDVDFDLDDFAEEDLIDYLEGKGYTIVEGKVNTKFDTFEELDKRIWQLYLVYTSASSDMEMHKALGSFFGEYYNKVSV